MGKRPIVTIGGIRTTIKACDSAKEGIMAEIMRLFSDVSENASVHIEDVAVDEV